MSYEPLGPWVGLTGSVSRAIGLHQEILALGCELMKVITVLEVALRNAVVENLARHVGVADRRRGSPRRFGWRGDERHRIRTAISDAGRPAMPGERRMQG